MVLIGFCIFRHSCPPPSRPLATLHLNPHPLYTYLNHTSNNERGRGRREYSVLPSPTSCCRKRRKEDKKKTHWCVAESNPLVCTVLFSEKRMWTEGGAAQSAASCVCFFKWELWVICREDSHEILLNLFLFLCDVYFLFFSMCYFYGFWMMYLLIEREWFLLYLNPKPSVIPRSRIGAFFFLNTCISFVNVGVFRCFCDHSLSSSLCLGRLKPSLPTQLLVSFLALHPHHPLE